MVTKNRLGIASYLATALALISIPLLGCSASVTGEPEINKWNSSKDVKAVVTKSGYGATTSFVYRVFVSSTDNDGAQEILRADKLGTIDISWENDNTLLIQVPCGRIFKFQNFYDVLKKDGELIKRVSIVLSNNGICKNASD